MQTDSLYSCMESADHGITCVHNYAVAVSVDKQWFLFTLSCFSAWIGNSVFPTFMWSTTQVAHVETRLTKYPHPTPHPPYCSAQPPYRQIRHEIFCIWYTSVWKCQTVKGIIVYKQGMCNGQSITKNNHHWLSSLI